MKQQSKRMDIMRAMVAMLKKDRARKFTICCDEQDRGWYEEHMPASLRAATTFIPTDPKPTPIRSLSRKELKQLYLAGL